MALCLEQSNAEIKLLCNSEVLVINNAGTDGHRVVSTDFHHIGVGELVEASGIRSGEWSCCREEESCPPWC